MRQSIELDRGHFFEASTNDFASQARHRGWDFWRGVALGFVASFPLAYIAATGETLLGLGA